MIIEDVKKELINNPDKLVQLIEAYDFHNVKVRNKYISFGRAPDSSPKSITIRLENNDWLYVKDYPLNINQEFFAYIMEQRNVEFRDIISTLKGIFGSVDFESRYKKRSIFGGIYDKAKGFKEETKLKVYDESVLKDFMDCTNLRFLKDNISFETQKRYEIGYDLESSGITIPIRSEIGDLIGVKIRCNYDSDDPDFQKYWYKIPCLESQTLYGFSQNYDKLISSKRILVFESEKSVMQCNTYGIYNAVALGSGSISKKQIRMILSMHPDEVLFLHDNSYKEEAIMRNIDFMKNYGLFFNTRLGYWDYKLSEYQDKVSPSDLGKKTLLDIINNQIKYV